MTQFVSLCLKLSYHKATPQEELTIVKNTQIALRVLTQWSDSGQEISLADLAREIVTALFNSDSD